MNEHNHNITRRHKKSNSPMHDLKIFSHVIGCDGGVIATFGLVCFKSALNAGFIETTIDILALVVDFAKVGLDIDLLDQIEDCGTSKKNGTCRRRR